MNNYKYACPYCGQHIEYTDGYSGQQMPCPMCQHTITFPAIAPGKLTSSLRLARNIAKPEEKFQFSLANVMRVMSEFKHWKVVGMCLVPFVLLAAALVAASVVGHHAPTDPAPAPAKMAVDPNALHQLTDLTRADMAVQDQLKIIIRDTAACQTADHNQAVAHNQSHGVAANTKPIDDVASHAHQVLLSDRKAFDAAYAKYQKLGGTVDYPRQLP